MEQHAHPWAHHLSKGYMLQYQTTHTSHQLQAVDTEEKDPEEDRAAHLTWASKTPKQTAGGAPKFAPGEVEMIANESFNKRGAGLGSALFNSAHHWNFGQTTVPIHSPIRTKAGQAFATKTRPDLKPDIWFNAFAPGNEGRFETNEGEPTKKYEPTWDLPEGFHPYQREQIAKQQAAAQKMKKPAKKPKGQGTLF
jgi:hypothetical protein